MSQKSEITNFASEFYVLSKLYRINLEPVLTLGNKKSIDIIIKNEKKYLTIDVKGLRSKTCWLLGSKKPQPLKNHFYILISYLNKINDIKVDPVSYIIPSQAINLFTKPSKKGFIIPFKTLNLEAEKFKENWKSLL